MSETKSITLDEFIEKATEKRKEKRDVEASVTVALKPKRKAMAHVPSHLIIAKKQPNTEEIRKWLSTKPGFIEGLTQTEFEPTRLYRYQVAYLIDRNPFKHIDKSRQTGFSYVFAAEAIAEAHLMDSHTEIFISITQEEANEKIVYARSLYDSMPLAWKKKLIVDNKRSLEFESTTGEKRTRTRIISHAQREPRGKGGNTKIILDEAAHYTYGDQIYAAALPIITRGYGAITVGSTPLGKSGIHWEIANNPEKGEYYTFFKVYWWNCPAFVAGGKFKEAKKRAPHMSTPERVKEFGSPKLKAIYHTYLDLETFQQEYECHHVDETVSFIPMSLINRCVYRVVTDEIFDQDDENAGTVLRTPMEEQHPGIRFRFYDSIESIIIAKNNGVIRNRLLAGFDVGRKHDAAEFIIAEENSNPVIVLYRKSFRNEPFAIMKGELKRAMDNLPIRKLGIDRTGIGWQLAEEFTRAYPGRAEEVNFTQQWKEESASNVRRLLEAGSLAIPDKRDFKSQFHSIKRMVTEHGNLRIDAEANREHHGDVFWATALLCSFVQNRPQLSYSIDMSTDDRMTKRVAPVKIVRPEQRIFNPVVSRNISPWRLKGFGLMFDPEPHSHSRKRRVE